MCDFVIYTDVFIDEDQKVKLDNYLKNTDSDVSELIQTLLNDFIANLPPEM